MKKFAIAAVAALVAVSAFATASWIGDSAINANGTWYYDGNSDMTWCTGGAFDGANLGEIYSLTLGGQIQFYDQGGSWGEGTGTWDILNYSFDDTDSWKSLSVTYIGDDGSNMKLQSGGVDFTTTALDLSGLSAGAHTISIYWGPVDGCYDNNWDETTQQAKNYTASFTKAVPEPATMSLLGLGALAMVLRRKLRK